MFFFVARWLCALSHASRSAASALTAAYSGGNATSDARERIFLHVTRSTRPVEPSAKTAKPRRIRAAYTLLSPAHKTRAIFVFFAARSLRRFISQKKKRNRIDDSGNLFFQERTMSMGEYAAVTARCAFSGKLALARTLGECAGAVSARDDALFASIKLASPARPVCVELAAVWVALFAVAGLECSAQRALETDGDELRCTPRLASLVSMLVVVSDGLGAHIALECVARTLARFRASMQLRELVVVAAESPYVVAERMRAAMREQCDVTTSAVRASFCAGNVRVVVLRDAARDAAETERAFCVVLALAPLANSAKLCVHADAHFRVRGENLVCGKASYALLASVPERWLAEPAVRVAAMDGAWRDAVDASICGDLGRIRACVAECFARAGKCLGARERGALIDLVYARVRGARCGACAAPHVQDDWHDDLARASARLAIALVHNAANFLDKESECARVQPALAVLLEGAHALSGNALLRASFASLEGATMRALSAACIYTEIIPAPTSMQEFLCVLFALFRARMQTVRDAEARLGCGRALRVETRVERCEGREGREGREACAGHEGLAARGAFRAELIVAPFG
jgi:hypothetical protein